MLNGGVGQDRFLFNTTLNATTNYDLIQGFGVSGDRIVLANAIFTALTTTGTLSAARFHVGTAATQSSHRIIYDSSDGQLYYDADGSGPIAAIRFARLAAGLALSNTNIIVQ